MFSFLRYLIKRCKGTVFSIFIIHTFTFVPAAFAYAFEETHIGYYLVVLSISFITSLIMYWSTKEFYENEQRFFYNFLLPLNLFFVVLYLIFVFEVLTIYYQSVRYFASIAEVEIASEYIGPSRLIVFFVNMSFYNFLFIKQVFKKFKELRSLP